MLVLLEPGAPRVLEAAGTVPCAGMTYEVWLAEREGTGRGMTETQPEAPEPTQPPADPATEPGQPTSDVPVEVPAKEETSVEVPVEGGNPPA